MYGNLETKIDSSLARESSSDQILKNDTDLSAEDQRIRGTEQFYKIDNTIRVAEIVGNILQTIILHNNTLSIISVIQIDRQKL